MALTPRPRRRIRLTTVKGKEATMKKRQRLLPAIAIGAILVLGTAASLTACGDDDDDNTNVPATGDATTEQMMSETTEHIMTETTEQMMSETTEQMMSETTEQMMTETTGG
jgi:hypothetical protein